MMTMHNPQTQLLADKTPITLENNDLFIAHLNEEHQDELLMLTSLFTPLGKHTDFAVVSEAKLMAIYQEGFHVCVPQLPTAAQDAFVHFKNPVTTPEALHAEYITLLQAGAKKLGKKAIKLRTQQFTVQDSYPVTRHMQRLVLTAPKGTPLSHAGYAYLFRLAPEKPDSTTELENEPEKTKKEASEETSESEKPSAQLRRYYTLRKAWQDDETGNIMAWVDVYLHGDTLGGNWGIHPYSRANPHQRARLP